MSQFDEEGNGPSIENGPNENRKDKVGKVEKEEEKIKKKKKERVESEL